jgi:hypothetical protein
MGEDEKPGNEEEDSTFRRYQDMVGGATSGLLKALTKYLPHLIVAVVSVAGVGGSYLANRSKESADTEQLWRHSGNWTSNITALAESQSMASNVLQEQIDELRRQLGGK